MTFEISVENPEVVFKMLFGKDMDLVNGNLRFGAVKNFRMDNGQLLADCEIGDMQTFEYYGSKGVIAGFPAKPI
jgi:hypothetical protein